jgi:predicted ATPase with chaperone activity
MLYSRFSHLNPKSLYDHYASQQRLSMRSWLNVLRVAQSIADYEDAEVSELNVLEALSYRFIQRKLATLKLAA